MDYVIDEEFRQAHRGQTKQERANLEILIREEGPRPGSLILASIDGKLFVKGGHHTLAVCKLHGIEPPTPLVHIHKDRESVLEWIEREQKSRRNLALPEMSETRVERLARVRAARAEGKSTRTIAEEENISQTQIRMDLKTQVSRGGECSPEKVTGKDSKEYASSVQPATVCTDCWRKRRGTDPRGCQKCTNLKADVRAKKMMPQAKPKKKKQGAIIADAAMIYKQYGDGAVIMKEAVRQFYRLLGKVTTPRAGQDWEAIPDVTYHAIMRNFTELQKLVTALHKEAIKKSEADKPF